MTTNPPQIVFNHIVAFEVSKEKLVVHTLPDNEQWTIDNKPQAVRRLIKADERCDMGFEALQHALVLGVIKATGFGDEHLLGIGKHDHRRNRTDADDGLHQRDLLPQHLAPLDKLSDLPIVFGTGVDPVELGLVASLDRPGANVTGIANLAAEMAPKKLQLLRDLIPKAAVFGVLADPAVPSTPSTIADLQAAARALGLQLFVVNARADSNLETAFATLSQQRVAAVLVTSSTLYNRRKEQLAALAARHALPAMFPYREYALAGGLMSYGSSFGYWYRQVGIYTGRILNGYNPADLPVVRQVTKIELAINLKTAKSLGLTIPETLLAIADEVIQ